MILSFLLLAQTKTSATIEIILFLLVAAIIGYITAWLYYRSVYMKKIGAREAELEKREKMIRELKEQLDKLQSERDNLERELKSVRGEIENKNVEIRNLDMKHNALQTLHTEAVEEIEELKIKLKAAKASLEEKDDVLVRVARRKHLLDYSSFGTATAEEKDNLKMIKGIGPFIEKRLHALEIFTFRQISKFSKKDIDTVNEAIEYFRGRIERDKWLDQAKELLS